MDFKVEGLMLVIILEHILTEICLTCKFASLVHLGVLIALFCMVPGRPTVWGRCTIVKDRIACA